MSKKKKGFNPGATRVAGTAAERELQHLRHKDLQRACVARGMEFEKVVQASVLDLQGWFCKNYDNGQSLQLLNEYDDWKDEELKARGYKKGDPMFHPSLRLGFIAPTDEEGGAHGVKKPRLKSLDKKEKPKRERIEGTKVFSGTKKALTYQLTGEGLDQKEIIEKVMEAFPEASEKSIKIWNKRHLKELAAKKI